MYCSVDSVSGVRAISLLGLPSQGSSVKGLDVCLRIRRKQPLAALGEWGATGRRACIGLLLAICRMRARRRVGGVGGHAAGSDARRRGGGAGTASY